MRGRPATPTVNAWKMASKEEVLSGLHNVLRDAEQSGVPLKAILNCLDNEINSSSRSWSTWNFVSFTSFKLIPALVLVVLLHIPLLQVISGSVCILPAPLFITGLIHPLANCSACQGVTEAPRLVNLTRKNFVLHYAHSLQPIVVVEAALHWPAMEVFSYDYFRSLYSSYPEAINADTSKGQFFSYSSNICNLKELFDLPSERAAMVAEKWYVGW